MPRFTALSRKRLSLRTKVFFLFAGAALLTVVPALMLIRRAVERGVYERAEQELQRASDALDSNWALRDSLLTTEASARASAPGLVGAWEAGNLGRMGRILKRGLQPDRVALAADTAGTVLVGPDSLPGARGLLGVETVLTARGEPVRIAVWPVMNDSGVVLGMVGVGTRLGSATVRDLKKNLSGTTDIALVVGDSLVGTTLPDSIARALRGEALATLLRTQGIVRRDPAGRPYLAAVRPLRRGGVPSSILLLRPVADELTVAQGILQSMFGIGFAALLLALLLAGVVARIVARPAQALAEASVRLARGDYRAPLPPPGGDEIGQLARAFAEMRSAIAEREGRLRSAQAEMIHREKLAAMGRLVAQLSHEINNPIYNIQNCLEALERRGNPDDPNREFLLLAQEELSRMASLTRRMLDQSRPLADAAAPLNLNTAVQRVLGLAGGDLGGRGIRVETWLARSLPSVVAHPDAIQQVLANLVNNAMDAMPEGGTLRVTTRADADAVEVVVEDTGSGITEEQLPHIFEAFYTTKPGVRGLGLGLFVSEGIIRGHRGRIVVESRPGEGSRFVVRLPRQTLDETLSGEPRPEEAMASVVA
ncbi:MAG TPA: HAMP domain-containing sensor histidine kinase [Longimicrobiaceae bacterium]